MSSLFCLRTFNHTIKVMHPINEFGSEEQKKKYLPDLAAGKTIGDPTPFPANVLPVFVVMWSFLSTPLCSWRETCSSVYSACLFLFVLAFFPT
jgi:hypothetical protein